MPFLATVSHYLSGLFYNKYVMIYKTWHTNNKQNTSKHIIYGGWIPFYWLGQFCQYNLTEVLVYFLSHFKYKLPCFLVQFSQHILL